MNLNMNYAATHSSFASTYDPQAECASRSLSLGGRVAATTAVLLAVFAPQMMHVSNHVQHPTRTTSGQNTLVEHKPSTATTGLGAENLLYRVMSNPFVADFKQRVPHADLGAIQAIFELAVKNFSGNFRMDSSFSVVEEDAGPALFLSLDTHGLDFDDQLLRELKLRDEILSNPRLAAAKPYIVLAIA